MKETSTRIFASFDSNVDVLLTSLICGTGFKTSIQQGHPIETTNREELTLV